MELQLQELIELQKEQNQLLRKHLTRIRFSLWALLLLTTFTSTALGIYAYTNRSQQRAAAPQPAGAYFRPTPALPMQPPVDSPVLGAPRVDQSSREWLSQG